jgi:hypothetical protein
MLLLVGGVKESQRETRTTENLLRQLRVVRVQLMSTPLVKGERKGVLKREGRRGEKREEEERRQLLRAQELRDDILHRLK